jgi:hypothetical protein
MDERSWTAGLVAGAIAILAVAGAAGPGAGATRKPPRQSGKIVFTTSKRGAATGASFHVKFRNPENPSQKPHTVSRIVVHSPKGTTFDSKAAPQCDASDAELQAEGPDACPPESKVGGGLAVSDTGSSGPFPPRYTTSRITQFNGHGELLGVGVNEDIPAIKTVTHTKFKGTTASTDFPTFPGMGPPDDYTPLKSLTVDFPPRKSGSHALTRTPPHCPRSHRWTIVTEFTYVDELTQRLVSHSPCRPKHKRP